MTYIDILERPEDDRPFLIRVERGSNGIWSGAAGLRLTLDELMQLGQAINNFDRRPKRPKRPDDYWCEVCDRGAEGCEHPIEEPA